MKIGVGTLNPAKLDAVERYAAEFGLTAKVTGYDVATGVSAMPMSDHETRLGAMNRARAVLAADPEVTFGIGLEGGVSMLDEQMFLVNWGAAADRSGRIITAGGARIVLPDALSRGILDGRELGDVVDDYVHQKNVHQHGGTIGILTDGRVTRSDMFLDILRLIGGLYAHSRN
jgi:inosine/xanthosine triphosphatase